MLKVISPKGQKFHQASINAFLDLLKVYQGLNLSLERRKKSTLLIGENNEHEVYGGAILYPQIVDSADDMLLDRYEDTFCAAFATYRPQMKKFWIARICFCLDADLLPDTLDDMGRDFWERFYDELYDGLKAFGHSNDIEFLAFSLYTLNLATPPFFNKAWPYNMPVVHSDDSDTLSHGILSLKKTKFIPRVSKKSSLERVAAKKIEVERIETGRDIQ